MKNEKNSQNNKYSKGSNVTIYTSNDEELMYEAFKDNSFVPPLVLNMKSPNASQGIDNNEALSMRRFLSLKPQ